MVYCGFTYSGQRWGHAFCIAAAAVREMSARGFCFFDGATANLDALRNTVSQFKINCKKACA